MKRILFLFVALCCIAVGKAQYNDGNNKIFYYASIKHQDILHFCYFIGDKCYYTQDSFDRNSIMNASESKILTNISNGVYKINVAVYNPQKSSTYRKVYNTNVINGRTNEKRTLEFYNNREKCNWMEFEYVRVEKESTPSGGSGRAGSNPTTSNSPVNPTGGYNPGGSSYGGNNKNEGSNYTNNQKKTQRKWRDCSHCKGTGKVIYETSVPTFGNDIKKQCSICGASYWSSSTHAHVDCPICHGNKGFWSDTY